jgi:hypothetical protein
MSEVLELEVFEIPKEMKEIYWNIFKKHHYLTENLNKAATCYVAYLWGQPVAFNSILSMPSGTMKNAWREHRLVVLGDYQGMSIGNTLSEAIGKIVLAKGGRYFSKTANIKLGEYRDNSPNWKGTSKNKKIRKDIAFSTKAVYNNIVDKNLALRNCYSHEYVGK